MGHGISVFGRFLDRGEPGRVWGRLLKLKPPNRRVRGMRDSPCALCFPIAFGEALPKLRLGICSLAGLHP